MIGHSYVGALRAAIFAATLGAHDVRVCDRGAIREREPIVSGRVGGGGGRAHLIRRIIRVVENDGHCHQICAAAARELSGDRDAVPDELLLRGGGGSDGRGSLYPPWAPLLNVSVGDIKPGSGSVSADALVPQSKSRFV